MQQVSILLTTIHAGLRCIVSTWSIWSAIKSTLNSYYLLCRRQRMPGPLCPISIKTYRQTQHKQRDPSLVRIIIFSSLLSTTPSIIVIILHFPRHHSQWFGLGLSSGKLASIVVESTSHAMVSVVCFLHLDIRSTSSPRNKSYLRFPKRSNANSEPVKIVRNVRNPQMRWKQSWF